MADDINNDTLEEKCEEKKKLTPMEERLMYFETLREWLQDWYRWQTVAAMMPYYVMSQHIANTTTGSTQSPQVPPMAMRPDTVDGNTEQQNEEVRQRRPPREQLVGPYQPPGSDGYEYRIPPLWKRFAAEFIDSVMLFLLKLSITFIAIDIFDFVDIEDLDLFQANLHFDLNMTYNMTYGILILEMIHRMIVCIFEAFWLHHGVYGFIGGATPGKYMMGLRVVQCRSVVTVDRPNESNVVLVSPGTDLGLPLAIARSVVKNLILALLFPFFFSVFFFKCNRTLYDMICNSIVVEDAYRNANNRIHQQ